MGRRIVACAALAALMVALSACRMHSTLHSQPAPVAHHEEHHEGGMHDDGMHGPARHCVREHDCTACYRSEADRDMGRLDDDLPPGGCCCPCGK